MKWGPQAKLIDEALLKYYFVNISLLPRYIFIQHTKSIKTHNITQIVFFFLKQCAYSLTKL